MTFFSKKKIQSNACCVTLLLLIILGVLYILYARYEGFLSGGAFPVSLDGGLLAPPNGKYNMQAKGRCSPGLSKETYKTEWKLYPYTPLSSYAQVTNNKRYWSIPTNGTSTPPEISGGLYRKKRIKRLSPLKPPQSSYIQDVRVNYYMATP